MTLLEKLKLYLNISLEDKGKDPLLDTLLEDSQAEVSHYTGREKEWLQANPVGHSAIVQVAVIKYNRIGTEGMTSQTFAGSMETYSGYKELQSQLTSITKARIL